MLCLKVRCTEQKNLFLEIWRKITTEKTSHQESQRNLLEIIGNKLNIQKLDDWYNFDFKTISTIGGEHAFARTPNSLYHILKTAYPEHSWQPFRFKKIPIKLLTNKNTHRQYFDELAKKLNIEHLDGWYSINRKDLAGHSILAVLKHYEGSLSKALISCYPEHSFKPWLFAHPTGGLWKKKEMQKEFLEWLGKKLEIKTLGDWCKVKKSVYVENGGWALLQKYSDQPILLLQSIYPHYDWNHWEFSAVPSGYWKEMKNQRKFFDWLGKKLNFQTIEDWYKLERKEISEYGGSVSKALMTIYSEFPFKQWKFPHVSHGFWLSPVNRKAFLDDFAKENGIEYPRGWYKVTKESLLNAGARSLLEYHGNIYKLVANVYIDYDWKLWLFTDEHVPLGFWEKEENIREVLDFMAKDLKIENQEDWYQVTFRQICEYGGRSLIHKYGSLIKVLQKAYPGFSSLIITIIDKEWDIHATRNRSASVKTSSKVQNMMFKILQEMFPTIQEIHLNYAFEKEGYGVLLFDIFIPSLKLAFEYQGIQHYKKVGVFKNPNIRMHELKQEKMKEMGITLIEIPYWWDNLKESLVSIILEHRAELAPLIKR